MDLAEAAGLGFQGGMPLQRDLRGEEEPEKDGNGMGKCTSSEIALTDASSPC